MAGLRVQAPQAVDDECRIGHGVPDVSQEVGKLLQTAAVGGDVHFTLEEVVEFLQRQCVDRTVHSIVEEEVAHGGLEGECGDAWLHDEVHDVGGDQ